MVLRRRKTQANTDELSKENPRQPPVASQVNGGSWNQVHHNKDQAVSSFDKQTFTMAWKAKFNLRVLGFPGVLYLTPRVLSPGILACLCVDTPAPASRLCLPAFLSGSPWSGTHTSRPATLWRLDLSRQFQALGVWQGVGWALSGHTPRGLLTPWGGMRLEDQREPLGAQTLRQTLWLS